MPTDQELNSASADTVQTWSRRDSPTAVPKPVFIMIPKVYSECVSLKSGGPRTKVEYTSKTLYSGEKTFRTSAVLVPRLVPKYYVSVVRVDGEVELVTYHERIEFTHRMKMTEFSETVNNFPKEKSDTFKTTLTYNPDYKIRSYITGLELAPAQILSISAPIKDVSSAFRGEVITTCNEEELRLRGDNEHPVMLLNGTA